MSDFSNFITTITNQTEDFQIEYLAMNDESPEDYPLQIDSIEDNAWYLVYIDWLATQQLISIKEILD